MARILQFSLFVLVMMTITGSIHYYFWMRLVRDTQFPSPWHRIIAVAVVVLGVSLPVMMFVSRLLPPTAAKVASYVPYVWMGMMFLLFVLLLGFDLMKLLVWITSKISGASQLAPDPERRLFLSRCIAGLTVGGAAGLTAVSVYRAKADLMLREVEVVLDQLPRELSGFTIAQVSDLHVGLTVGKGWVEQVVTRVNRLGVDLVAVTGDLMDGSVANLREQVAPMARLRARHGVFFVTGNHEYYSGVVEWLPVIESLGMRVLRNERVSIGQGEVSFDLAGVDDYHSLGMAPGHGPDLPRALEGRDPARALVLLAHQPSAVREAADLGVGLQLSGHTHGGQIWPFRYLVGLNQPYVTGLHRHGPKTQIYVTSGTGYWGPPMRLGTRNEISLIRLISPQAADRKESA